jgi:hypothetical protein
MVWEIIKNKYMDVPILIIPTWDLEFHVCTYVSNLAIGAMIAQNPFMCPPHCLCIPSIQQCTKNYTIVEVLAMIYALHKFKHYLLGNKFVFYVDHMTLVYLI